MKRSRYSPATASMICSSRPVPRVGAVAWVTTGEQGRTTVGAGQHADAADVDRAHGTGVATVDTQLTAQDAARAPPWTQVGGVVDGIGVVFTTFGGQGRMDLVADGEQALGTLLLGGDAESFFDLGAAISVTRASGASSLAERDYSGCQPLPTSSLMALIAATTSQVCGLPTPPNIPILRQLQRASDSINPARRSRYQPDQVHLAGDQLGGRRVGEMYSPFVTDAACADRARRRNAIASAAKHRSLAGMSASTSGFRGL